MEFFNNDDTQEYVSKFVYRFIKENTITVGDISRTYKDIGFFGDEYLVTNYVPILSMGRKYNHTKAIYDFISHNPKLNFAIADGMSGVHIEKTFGIPNRDSNVFHISRKKVLSGNVRKKIDYVIIDGFLWQGSYSIGELFDAMRGNSEQFGEARIVGIGC